MVVLRSDKSRDLSGASDVDGDEVVMEWLSNRMGVNGAEVGMN